MRKQNRPPEPEELKTHAARWNQQWSDLKATNPKASFGWYETDKTSARDYMLPALRLMNQGHCSFCDAFPLIGSSNEPIEHFKPKSDPRFHELAYVWSNLYYSCERCQGHKGEQFEDGLLQPDAPEYECLHYFCTLGES